MKIKLNFYFFNSAILLQGSIANIMVYMVYMEAFANFSANKVILKQKLTNIIFEVTYF